MILFAIKLILAHLIADFLFQPGPWIRDKLVRKHRSPYLYWHVLVHAVLTFILLGFELQYWLGILIIAVTHTIIDATKMNLNGKMNGKLLFGLDQLAHFLVLAFVVWFYFPYVIAWGYLLSPAVMLFLIALILVTVVAAIVIKMIMSTWEFKEDKEEDSLPNAGMYIGVLERIFVFGFIVLQQWQAIGLLIAAKSIFRFSDLSRAKDRKLTEYILIGTLISFGWAILIGVLFLQALRKFN